MDVYDNPRRVPDDKKVEYVNMTFSDGRKFRIPAEIIADSKANYYSSRDESTTYEEEYEIAIKDAFGLQDWLQNNMNWEDVEDEAELINRKEADPSEEFVNADCSFNISS